MLLCQSEGLHRAQDSWVGKGGFWGGLWLPQDAVQDRGAAEGEDSVLQLMEHHVVCMNKCTHGQLHDLGYNFVSGVTKKKKKGSPICP